MRRRFQDFDKAKRFEYLAESVRYCDLCPRLSERSKVLSCSNGSPHSRVLFIAEAPGRLGADVTGIPLYGDRTGANFDVLLSSICWRRKDIFITNALLCNPKQENGNNSTPTADEIANCSVYLEMVIELISPDVIVTLGRVALSALELIAPHGISLREGVAKRFPWRNSLIFPLYHPGPRAMMHRSLAKQKADFMLLSRIVHPTRGLSERKKGKETLPWLISNKTPIMHRVVRVLLELGGEMTYFKITKLMYLVDLRCIQRFGCTVASPIYLRQAEGPWPPKLKECLDGMDGYEVRVNYSRRAPIVAPGPSPRFQPFLDDNVIEVISEVLDTYGSMSNSEIKTAVYLTDPMRYILESERRGKKMLNRPVLYKNKTSKELAEEDAIDR